MANYCCATRTNYFHVKDPVVFKEFMKTVSTSDDYVSVWDEKDENGDPVFGFGCYGTIYGIAHDGDDVDDDYDEFVNGLAELVAEDDAIIIMESGNEKLRYVVGSALVITSKHGEYFSIDSIAAQAAAEILGNPNWKTRLDY